MDMNMRKGGDVVKLFNVYRKEENSKRGEKSNKAIYFIKDVLVTVILFAVTAMLCLFLRSLDPHNDTSYVAVIFFMDVFLTALFTEGYFFGIIAAVAGVLAVDYVFTLQRVNIGGVIAERIDITDIQKKFG